MVNAASDPYPEIHEAQTFFSWMRRESETGLFQPEVFNKPRKSTCLLKNVDMPLHLKKQNNPILNLYIPVSHKNFIYDHFCFVIRMKRL